MYNVIRTATLDGLSDLELGKLYSLLCQGRDKLVVADVSTRSVDEEEQLIDELLTPSRN